MRLTEDADDELLVVPGERHLERLAREGRRAETRASLRARLATACLPDVRFADVREARLALAFALEEARAAAGQLDLFGAPSEGGEDPLLATLRGRGGASWVRAVAAIDEALSALRSRGVTAAHLERVRGAGVAPSRARMLGAAMRALDDALARAGARDGRLLGTSLAAAIRAAGADAVIGVVRARRVRARWLLGWDPQDLTWWRALDETLARRGGHARVSLPTFDKRLEGSRERDPLEVIADSVAQKLDAAPDAETIAAVLGDFTNGSATVALPVSDAVSLVRVADARSEARVVARLVRAALDEGACVERVVIAYPVRDERTLAPLRRALDEEVIVFHDAIAPLPTGVPVVAAALHALVAAESLDRVAVARLLRSRYLDAPRLLGAPGEEALGFRDAERVLDRLARSLETRATAAGEDALSRLVLTAAGRRGEDEAMARRVAAVLARGRAASSRRERVRGARGLFHELGFGARAGRGALKTFARDEAPSGVDRAERLAVARDVRAWEGFESALDAYEALAHRTGASERSIEPDVFRLELAEMLDASTQLPGAGRAAAVRLVRLADVAGEALDLLVVLDVNDGVVPRDVQPVTLVSEALEAALVRATRGELAEAPPNEVAARDLAALAMGAAEARSIVLVTTAEDGAEAAASPSRLFLALERARGGQAATVAPITSKDSGEGMRSAAEVARRAIRERTREAFFLDPTRPQSDIVGRLQATDAIAEIVARETGALEARALAVTALEQFAKCPFKGYALSVLAAREGEEQRELPDAREEGTLGHVALAAAFVATRDAWSSRPRDAAIILERGLAAADEALRATAGHAPLRAIVRMRVRESVRAVLGRALADETWDFVLAEQAFGDGKPWASFHVAPSDGGVGVWLRGTVDRIDRAHDAPESRVIDYKRSKNTVREASSQLGETALQVPLYAAVTAERLELRATGIYSPIQSRDLAMEGKASARAEERVTELVRRGPGGTASEIELRVLAVTRDARAGRFAPLPAREAECMHCGASGGCRKPRFAMAPTEDEETPS